MRWSVLLVLSLAALAGCVKPVPIDSSAPVAQVEMVAKQFGFEPAVVTVHEGDHVQLFITSADVTHGISIRSLGVHARLEPGKVTQVDFMAVKQGMYEFRCGVYCGSGHAEMLGAIEVIP